MGNGYEPITDEDERAAVRAQARRVVTKSLVAAAVASVVVFLLV